MKIELDPIGTIQTPFTTLDGIPIQPAGGTGIKGQIRIFDEYADGLCDLDGFSHIILLYYLHKSSGYSMTVTPFLDTVTRGLFATRAPRRPNPIGLSVVKLIGVEGAVLQIENIDILDGTPLLDIKPYVPEFDHSEEFRTGWLETAARKARTKRSDARFCESG